MQSLYLSMKNKLKTLFPDAKFYVNNKENILENSVAKIHSELRNKIMLNNYFSVYFENSCHNLSFYIEVDKNLVFYSIIYLERIIHPL